MLLCTFLCAPEKSIQVNSCAQLSFPAGASHASMGGGGTLTTLLNSYLECLCNRCPLRNIRTLVNSGAHYGVNTA